MVYFKGVYVYPNESVQIMLEILQQNTKLVVWRRSKWVYRVRRILHSLHIHFKINLQQLLLNNSILEMVVGDQFQSKYSRLYPIHILFRSVKILISDKPVLTISNSTSPKQHWIFNVFHIFFLIITFIVILFSTHELIRHV